MTISIVKLGEVADVNWGDTSVTKASYVDQGYVAYSATGPDGYLPYADYNRSAVVLSAIGARCGKTWFAEGKWSCIKNTIRFWSTDVRLDDRYLYWITHREDFFRKRGAAQPFITIGDARATEIPLPSLDKQQRVAGTLDKADAICRERKRAIELLNSLLPSIFSEMFGDPLANPRKLAVRELGSITSKIGSGATPTGGDATYKEAGIALVRSMNVRDEGFSPKGLAFIDDTQAAKLANVKLEADDVLLNITGASVARVCLCPEVVLPARVNQHVSIIRPKERHLSNYIASLLKVPTMKAKLLGIAEAGATRQAITKEQISRLKIPIPPRNDVVKFNQAVEEISLLTQRAASAMSSADSLFRSLQHSAFSRQL